MIWIGIAASVFLLDYKIKKWAEKNLKGKGRKPIGKTGCSLVLVHNKGFAGSKMKEKPEAVKAIHTIILVLFGILCILLGYFKKGNEMTAFGLSMILGGGASNLYDRWKQGYVTDYLGLPVAKKLVFNVSDLCIFAGAVIAMIGEMK
ncbi:MAG: signal peptidase II [Lachnospiraceae bacterium]|nr:signal peptidase II [Lachnospiraceae bacterium]